MVCAGPKAGILETDNQAERVRLLRQLPQERCDEAHTSLKEWMPILRRDSGEQNRDATLIFSLRLPHDQMRRSGGGQPMDRARIIARLITPQVVQLSPMPASGEREALSLADQFINESKRQRLDRRANEDFRRNLVERPFEEQTEGEKRLSPDAFKLQAPATGSQDWVRQQHRSLGWQVIDKEPAVEGLSSRHIEEP